jgi:hypothetical protein
MGNTAQQPQQLNYNPNRTTHLSHRTPPATITGKKCNTITVLKKRVSLRFPVGFLSRVWGRRQGGGGRVRTRSRSKEDPSGREPDGNSDKLSAAALVICVTSHSLSFKLTGTLHASGQVFSSLKRVPKKNSVAPQRWTLLLEREQGGCERQSPPTMSEVRHRPPTRVAATRIREKIECASTLSPRRRHREKKDSGKGVWEGEHSVLKTGLRIIGSLSMARRTSLGGRRLGLSHLKHDSRLA